MKLEFLKKDWFLALVITLLFGIAALWGSSLLEGLERVAYDFGVKMTNRNAGAVEKIAIIAIDDTSIEKIGRWPWPRSVLAAMIAQLAPARTKLIGLQIFLSETQADPGLAYLRKVSDFLTASRLPRLAPREAGQLAALLKQGEHELNADQKLAQTLPVAKNIFMPMFFRLGTPLGKPDAPLPHFVQRNHLTKVVAPGNNPNLPPPTYSALYPLAIFGNATAGIGHLNLIPDVDGGIRTEPLVLEYYGEYYPSLALLIAAKSLNLGPRDITVRLGEGIKLGNLSIKTDSEMQMYTGFYPARKESSPFITYSFYDVQSGKVPLNVFKNKVVLIGTTAVGVGSTQITPISKAMNGPELTANVVASILNQDFYTRPDWAKWVEVGIFFLLLAYLTVALPGLSAGVGASVSFVLFLMLLGTGHYLLLSKQVWLKSAADAMLLLVGHIALTTKRFFATERQKTQAETDSAHTNRMLGLTFQNQGQLDMALDKFRALPVDDSVLELIYNLALDFERKRQFNKAISAYDYILKHKAGFKDVAARKKRTQQADSTLVIGGRSASPGGTLILDGMDQKPTLGRYQIEKELGKGAMGSVYLGRDPKINRVVAIKTMALAQEFADHELVEVKARFFREAETAGRLNHPNIVTIYDAGEEHDLAYIAMEYLQGKDLTQYIGPETLLPVEQVLQIIATVAEALDYAHKQDVVHRDIKPANIMYADSDKSIKITDFGIARITASSRTKTGVILGTPSYMSPEQLSGKHIDGRSDLFSLGVMMYELLTGTLPFSGDSMATLMFQIANEKHPDITEVRSSLSPGIRLMIDKALHKDPAKRFQTGEQLRQAVEKCMKSAMKSTMKITK
jgi:serine/threonine-protein kinase